jgi:phytoene/squalene synthetase
MYPNLAAAGNQINKEERMKNGMREASSITKNASKQTYYTIYFLADRERVTDAFRAYAYFRWVDNVLDAGSGRGSERRAFMDRQKALLQGGYRGESTADATVEEQMLIDLIRTDTEKNSGLRCYLYNMMAVMAFDTERRGRLISQSELNHYTGLLATSVTEAMHYFIGHGSCSPQHEARYLAVTAAHITHMLRDTIEDVQMGYFNVPREMLDANHIAPQDVQSDAYRAWVQNRVELARSYFMIGREYFNRVENPRCRLAGFAYIARFEHVLDAIEQAGYVLQAAYPPRNRAQGILRVGGSMFSSFFMHHRKQPALEPLPVPQRASRKP